MKWRDIAEFWRDMNDPNFHHPRDRDPQQILQELKEYAVSRIATANNARAIVEDLERLEEITELEEAQLSAMRSVVLIESGRLSHLKEAVRHFEEFCRIPEPVWPPLGESGKRYGGQSW